MARFYAIIFAAKPACGKSMLPREPTGTTFTPLVLGQAPPTRHIISA